MIFRWFMSKTVRNASAAHKHYRRLLYAQRDLLSPEAIGAVQMALNNLKASISGGDKKDAILVKAQELDASVAKWLKPYPHHFWRENVEVLLVALAVAMGIRTFFLQPFKIPTGSMQPTLFGITSENLMDKPEVVIPTGWQRVKEWFQGVSYVQLEAPADGPIQALTPMTRFLIFNIKQTITIGGVQKTMWFPPDYGDSARDNAGNLVDPLIVRAKLQAGQSYQKGDDVIKLRVVAGDHLFVDRLTYNFCKPERGDIIVFQTAGIPEERRVNPPSWSIPADQFYIKRLVGLGGEKLQIGSDRHLVIDGIRLDSSKPHFENVYSFNSKDAPVESRYSGHISQQHMPFFPNNSTVFEIPKGHIMVMGDNTMSSLDSRYWGDFSATNVIGKSFFVYWPLNERFGWGYRR